MRTGGPVRLLLIRWYNLQIVYQKLSDLLHQLLEDFGFQQKPPAGGSGEQGTGVAGSGEGQVQARPGGRFSGMGPGGAGGEQGTSLLLPARKDSIDQNTN